MPTWNAPEARVRVYTFKEGLLSAVGHDLCLEARVVEVREEEGRLTAEIAASSIHTITAMKRGAESPSTLSDKDRADIDRNTAASVLHPERYPTIRFEADEVTSSRVSGLLSLHGEQRRVSLAVRIEGDRRVGSVELDQRDFGLKPFRALMGALKVKPVVRIEVSLPAA